MTEIDRPTPILLGRADGYGLAHQPPTDEVAPSLPLNGAMDGDDPHRIVRAVDDLRQGLGEGAGTRLVARGWHAVVQRFMAQRAGARRVVDIPNGSHAISVSQPRAVAELILEAAALRTAEAVN